MGLALPVCERGCARVSAPSLGFVCTSVAWCPAAAELTKPYAGQKPLTGQSLTEGGSPRVGKSHVGHDLFLGYSPNPWLGKALYLTETPG